MNRLSTRASRIAAAVLVLFAASALCVAAATETELTRVACVGDSITFGAGIRDRARNSYPVQLGRLLGAKWEVRNFGVSAATLLKKGDKPYWRLRAFKAATDYKPHVVVIKLGTNDTKPNNWRHKGEFAADCKAMIGAFAKLPSRPKIYVCLPVPAYPERWGIRDSVIKGEVIPILKQVAKETGAGVIDLYTPLSNKPKLFPDKIHPNAEGAGVMAKVIGSRIADDRQVDFLIAATKATGPPKNGPFAGKKTIWHGFDRYQFTAYGKKCFLVAPKKAAPGRPWIWRARFFGHEPQTDLALLNKGFHVAYMDVAGMFGSPMAVVQWNKFYKYLTETLGFSNKPALEGMSRGGLIVFNWASANPDKVACIYADAPVCDITSWPGGKGKGKGSAGDWRACLRAYGVSEGALGLFKVNPIDKLAPLAKAKVPILCVCGGADKVVPVAENTAILAERYKKLGGPIKVIVKKGVGHHPHSLKDPAPIVEFILKHTGK